MALAVALTMVGCRPPVESGCTGPLASGRPVPFDSAGIVVVPLNEFEVLEACRLNPVLQVRIGDPEGPGRVDGDRATVRFDASTRMYWVAWSGPAGPLDGFDETGRYVGSIGRAGQGPGEFASSPSRFFTRDGLVTVANYPTQTWMTFRSDGALVSERRIAAPVQPALVFLTPDSVLMTGSPNPNGIHSVVSASSGAAIAQVPNRVFGLAAGELRSISLVAGGRLAGTIATAPYEEWAVREWDVRGRLLSVVRGRAPGLPEVARVGITGIYQIRFDAVGRLWVMTTVAPGGASAMAPVEAVLPEASGPSNPWFHIRTDIFDLARGVHEGSWVSESQSAGFVERDDELWIHQMEYDAQGNPFLAIYRVLASDEVEQ